MIGGADDGIAAPPTARLFVALDLPEAVVAALVAWRRPLLAGAAGPRAVAPEALHVTLCFLGERPQAAIAPIGEAVRTCAASAGAVERLALGAPLWLPPRRPRVLAVALEDREGRLAALQEAVSAGLAAGGWHEPEARPYLPHVTVARMGARPPGGGRAPRVSLAAPPALRFAGAGVTLYRSRPGRAGARYEVLARVPPA